MTQPKLLQQTEIADQVSVPTDVDVNVDAQVETYTQADNQAEAAAQSATQTLHERYTAAQEEAPARDALQDEA